MGFVKAAELPFSGEVIDAGEAFRIGLVNQLVPHEELAKATEDVAGRIARNEPIPIALTKRGLQDFHRWDLAQAVDYEAHVRELCKKSEDRMEGFTSFLEKRGPAFRGR